MKAHEIVCAHVFKLNGIGVGTLELYLLPLFNLTQFN